MSINARPIGVPHLKLRIFAEWAERRPSGSRILTHPDKLSFVTWMAPIADLDGTQRFLIGAEVQNYRCLKIRFAVGRIHNLAICVNLMNATVDNLSAVRFEPFWECRL